jgi:hypothetical protein
VRAKDGELPPTNSQGSSRPCGVSRAEINHRHGGDTRAAAIEKEGKKERLEMKTTRINTMARFTGITIALALFVGVAVEAKAQEKGSAKGGGIKLLQLSGSKAVPPAAPSDYKQMSCGKCKDVVVTRAITDPKGLGARLLAGGVATDSVAQHLCDGCGVDWTISGHGKAKVAVANHNCTSCSAESLACCNTTKGSTFATKGMEKKFEIAPLK